jgi:hypothetical protein
MGNVTQPQVTALSGTTKTTLLTTTTDTVTVAGFTFSNASAAAVPCILYWTQSGGSDRIIWNGSIATKESGPDAYRQFPIRLRKGDAIKVVGAASVEVALFILDTPKNQ